MFPSFHMMRYVTYVNDIQEGTQRLVEAPRDVTSIFTKSVVGNRVMRDEIGNMFENFKTDIIISLSSQLDVLQVKKKQGGVRKNIYLYYVLNVERSTL
jgi:hypothetical protein